MNNISFDLYNLFYIVANTGSISKAAEILYISQPAVTQSIKKLEECLGGNLFYRIPKGVVLTEEGKKLYNYIKDSVEIMENAEKKFSQYVSLEEGTIRIKCGNTFGMSILYKAVVEFSKMFPNINIEISTSLTSQAIDDLSKGKCDMVIFKISDMELPSNVEVIEGPEDEVCFYATRKYLEEHPVKSYKDLENCNLILSTKVSNAGKIVKDFFEKNNIKIKSNLTVSSSEARRYFSLNNVGIAIGQKSLVQEDLDKGILESIDLEPKMPLIKAGIAILKNNISSFATLKLVDFIKDQFEE